VLAVDGVAVPPPVPWDEPGPFRTTPRLISEYHSGLRGHRQFVLVPNRESVKDGCELSAGFGPALTNSASAGASGSGANPLTLDAAGQSCRSALQTVAGPRSLPTLRPAYCIDSDCRVRVYSRTQRRTFPLCLCFQPLRRTTKLFGVNGRGDRSKTVYVVLRRDHRTFFIVRTSLGPSCVLADRRLCASTRIQNQPPIQQRSTSPFLARNRFPWCPRNRGERQRRDVVISGRAWQSSISNRSVRVNDVSVQSRFCLAPAFQTVVTTLPVSGQAANAATAIETATARDGRRSRRERACPSAAARQAVAAGSMTWSGRAPPPQRLTAKRHGCPHL